MAGIGNIVPAFKNMKKAENTMMFTPWKYKDAIKAKRKEWDLTFKPSPATPVAKVNYDPTETENVDLEEEAKRRRAGRRVPTVLESSSNGDTLG